MKIMKMFQVDNQNVTEREDGKRLNKKAIVHLIKFLNEMLDFMKCEEYNLRIRGSSLLIVVNNEFEDSREDGGLSVKLIDFSSVEILDQPEPDDNFTEGIE